MLFDHLPTSTLPDFVLRHIETRDIAHWYRYLSQPEVSEQTSWDLQAEADLLPYVWSAADNTPDKRLRLAIARAGDDVLIGTIGFHSVSAKDAAAEIAYDLAPEAWDHGIATAMCRTLVDWGHQHVGLVRIQATTIDANTRSKRVLERCGFAHEGLLRRLRKVRGTSMDFALYAHIA